jgi:DNA processing protein
MLNKDLLYQIAITKIPGVGDTLAKNLISYCGNAEDVFKQKKQKLLRIPGIGEKTAEAISSFQDFTIAEQEIVFIHKHKIKPLFYLNQDYPSRLKHFPDAPVMLYYLGNADLNNAKIISIVGTRKASEYGKEFVDELIHGLIETNCLILSGLAFGIDVQAHKQALKYDLPTVGVLAHGLDRIYPSSHKNTAKKMLENGGLLTECSSNTNPDRENFPKRNRIVAGLCDVLVVAETAEKGGAMITAEIANSYNKDVMALPGRIQDEYSKGCNKLIKTNKANIITCTEDLFYLMGWDQRKSIIPQQRVLPMDLDKDELIVMNYIREKGRSGIDDIAFELRVEQSPLALQLLEMEFKGLIRALPGKMYELV